MSSRLSCLSDMHTQGNDRQEKQSDFFFVAYPFGSGLHEKLYSSLSSIRIMGTKKRSQAVIECQQCNSNRKGTRIRCKKRTCRIADVCWQHLKLQKNLRIKKSTIRGAGYGLFTTKPLKANVIIDNYKRNLPVMTRKQIETQYPGGIVAQYVWCNRNLTQCIDAKSTQANVARYSNACDAVRGQAARCNAKFTNQGNLKTTKKIQANAEILCAYGPEYWGRRTRK